LRREAHLPPPDNFLDKFAVFRAVIDAQVRPGPAVDLLVRDVMYWFVTSYILVRDRCTGAPRTRRRPVGS